MPAEAIHLSALARTAREASPEVRALLERHPGEARLGAVFPDFAYFDRFRGVLLRYALGLELPGSPWGDRIHGDAPQRIGAALLAGARATSERLERDARLAFALGWFSHLAIDTALHPLVNRMAKERQAAEGGTEAHWHREVEKFQSILFHEEVRGHDFMGTPDVTHFTSVPGEAFFADPGRARLVDDALRTTLGASPPPGFWKQCAGGYALYTRLLGGFFGGRLAPPLRKQAARPVYYQRDDFSFRRSFEDAVPVSNAFVAAAFACFDAGVSQEAVETLLGVTGECSIDRPEEPARLATRRAAG